VGLDQPPEWLDVDGLQGYVLGRAIQGAADRRLAARRYSELVASATDVRLWESALRQQIYLGDEAFAERMRALADPVRVSAQEVPKVQRKRMRTLGQWLATSDSRDEALYRAHVESGMSMSEIARELGLSVSRVSRLIARAEGAKGKT
jgi:DNA-directed RNA polymerase specialized sigma24 family protein